MASFRYHYNKIFWGGDGVNEKGLSRKHIWEGMEGSLNRLQLDYVDMVFCHRPDPFTPTETVIACAMEIAFVLVWQRHGEPADGQLNKLHRSLLDCQTVWT